MKEKKGEEKGERKINVNNHRRNDRLKNHIYLTCIIGILRRVLSI